MRRAALGSKPVTDPLSGSFHRPFAEQLAALDLRMAKLVGTATWEDLQKAEHERAFVVAGAMKADLLADLAKAVQKAAVEGKGLEEFRAQFRDIVQTHGWHGWTGEGSAKGEAWRTRVIYQTNMATSYAGGRMAQLKDGRFSIWVYKHGNAKDPRPQHLAWDGVALPPDHPFWATHAPPNGWGCTCRIRGANSAAGVKRAGGDPGKDLPKGWDAIDPKTGAQVGIDKGWDYKVGAAAADEIVTLMAKVPKMPAPIGAAFVDALPLTPQARLMEAFGSFVSTSLATHVDQSFMIIGALKPAWIQAAQVQKVTVASAEIAMDDLGIQHTFRETGLVTAVSTKSRTGVQPKTSALDIAWFRHLPDHLRHPRAVILDQRKKTPAFLLVFDTQPDNSVIVVEVDVQLKKADGILNRVASGRKITLNDLHATLGMSGVVQIEGAKL